MIDQSIGVCCVLLKRKGPGPWTGFGCKRTLALDPDCLDLSYQSLYLSYSTIIFEYWIFVWMSNGIGLINKLRFFILHIIWKFCFSTMAYTQSAQEWSTPGTTMDIWEPSVWGPTFGWSITPRSPLTVCIYAAEGCLTPVCWEPMEAELTHDKCFETTFHCCSWTTMKGRRDTHTHREHGCIKYF